RFAQFATYSAFFESTKRCSRVEYGVAVDPNSSRSNLSGQLMCFTNIAGPNGGRQTKAGGIRTAGNFVDVAEFQYAQNGAKDFIGCNSHFVFNVCKQRRFDEVTSVATSFATANQLCAILFAIFDVAHD